MISNPLGSRRASAALALAALVLLAGGLTGCDLGTAFTVTSTADEVDADPGDGVCATATSACTLRAAVQEANALAVATTIYLAPDSVYPLTIEGIFEDAAATGDLDITAPYTHVVGHGATIQAVTYDRVIDHHAGTLQLDDLTITGGSSGHGSGLRNNHGTANLVRVKLTGNTASGAGGEPLGVAIEQLDGQLTVVGGEISGNSQTGIDGKVGAILQAGGSMSIIDTVVTHNEGQASLQWLGQGTYAVLYQTAGSAQILNSEVVDNDGIEYHVVCLNPPSSACSNVGFTRHAVGVLALGQLEIGHSRVSGNTTDLATSGSTVADPGTATIALAASAFDRCTATHVTSQGYNRFGAARCSSAATDVGPFSATVDQIPIGTASLCDATTPPDRLGVARPQGPACDIGPLEQ